jgi:hypothetical protein
MKTEQIPIQDAFVDALIGRSFPWHTAEIAQTGGDCYAYQVQGNTSDDPAVARQWYALVTDETGPFLDTLGPYQVSLWVEDEQTESPLTVSDAVAAINAVESLYILHVGETFIDEDDRIQTAAPRNGGA